MNAADLPSEACVPDQASAAIAAAPHRLRVRAALLKIGPQFPETPEGRLMLAVLGLALYDLNEANEGLRRDAKRYVDTDLACCEAVGVDCEWVRDVLKKTGVL